MLKSMQSSNNLGSHIMPTFSGAFLWHTMYPWPQRPSGLVELGFQELAKRWLLLLDKAEDYDIDLAYEIHSGEDWHDGLTFERLLAVLVNHTRAYIFYD